MATRQFRPEVPRDSTRHPQAHGPAAEIEKLKEALTPFGCKFFVSEWGFRPSKPAMEFDSVPRRNYEGSRNHACAPLRHGRFAPARR